MIDKVVKGIKIDPAIFTYNFSCKCTGECCHYGVYTDLKESEHILDIKDKIIDLMDETQTKDHTKWFEPPEKDEDFKSGIAVGTEIINGKCSFLDKDGLCTLQKLAIIEGEFEWKYKPLYCILFPLTIYEDTLTIDSEHIDRLSTCNINPIQNLSIFDACKEELKHFFGEDGLSEIEDFQKEHLSSQNQKKLHEVER